jgi:Protein of unknown function (DUF3710)
MFRRKSRPQPDDLATDEPDNGEARTDEPDTDDPGGRAGPWDVDELPDDGVDRVDVGSLLVPTVDGTELRLQVDEQTGQVQSVMLAGEDGALELRAFAAPRNGDLWSEVRPQISADVAQHGGTATERGGRWGVELVCNMQVLMPDGTQGIQPSRIVGVNGSRWLLRGTFLGRPAVEADDSAAWEDALASVAVRRGDHAMPVGDALPLVLPPDAQRASAP